MVSIETFRQMALALPNASEKMHFDRPSFRVKKIFATIDLPNNRACLMLSPVDQSVYCAIDNKVIYAVPNKWGLHGATYVDLGKVGKTLLKEALMLAYNNNCGNKKDKENMPRR